MNKVEEIKNYVNKKFEKSGQKWFVDLHIKVVENLAIKLAGMKNANKEIVKLAVWLHDIHYADFPPSATETIDDRHDVIGTQKARKILKEHGYDEKTIGHVGECIITHRCKGRNPRSLEAKILATADGMSHIENFLMLLFVGFVKYKMSIKQVYEWLNRKIDRDWNDKILFPEAKNMIKEKYEDIRLILNEMKGE